MNLQTKTRRVVLIHLSPREMADFVATDKLLLARNFQVRTLFYDGSLHGWPDALRILWAVARSDASLSWFAYHQAFFAVRFGRLLRKRSVVIIGGFEVALEERPSKEMPPKEARRLRYTLDNASAVLSVSEALATKARRWTSRPDLQVVPLAFDERKFLPRGTKDGSVTTTAYIRRDNMERKGLRSYVKAARLMPATRFYMVGKALDNSVNELRREAPSNLTLTGWLEEADLIARLQASSVYVQASTHEGFGSGLAQAMLCECVPVVTTFGALPEVVGEAGIYIQTNQPDEIVNGVTRALTHPQLGRDARERVVSRFGLEHRERMLRRAVLGDGL